MAEERTMKEVYIGFDAWKSVYNSEYHHMADLDWVIARCKHSEDSYSVRLMRVPVDIVKNDSRILRKTPEEIEALLT